MNGRNILWASLVVGSMVFTVAAGEPAQQEKAARLTIGSPAPELSVDKWVRGESIPSFEKGKVYVVEFWATWCGPCVRAMPHMGELAKSHPEVTFVAVTKPDKRNTLEQVEKMVKEKNGQGLMQYTVAWDEGKKSYGSYMSGADQRGIPCAFIVDQESRVAYIGHPMEMDAALDGVTKKTWDLDGAKRGYESEYEKEAKRNAYFEAMDGHDTAKAYAIADSLITSHFKDDAGTLNAIAWTIVDPDGEVKDKNLDIAMKAVKRAAEIEPRDAGILDTMARVQFLKGDVDGALKTQEMAIESAKDEEMKGDLKSTLEEYRAAKK